MMTFYIGLLVATHLATSIAIGYVPYDFYFVTL